MCVSPFLCMFSNFPFTTVHNPLDHIYHKQEVHLQAHHANDDKHQQVYVKILVCDEANSVVKSALDMRIYLN